MPLEITPVGQAVNRARQPFAEQIDYFRAKLNLPTERWTDIWQGAHDRAFVVAGAQADDLLTDLRDAVDSAIADGTTLEQFRKNFDTLVARHGWTGWTGEGSAAGRDWRTSVIYQTNLATSYAAGRLGQLRDPELLKLKPFWMYVHSDSVLTPRPLHLSWNGLVLPPDHQWWQTHYPPNGWGCQCRVVAVSRRDAERWGGRFAEPPDDGIDPRTGAPAGIDQGWDYMPGANAAADLARLAP